MYLAIIRLMPAQLAAGPERVILEVFPQVKVEAKATDELLPAMSDGLVGVGKFDMELCLSYGEWRHIQTIVPSVTPCQALLHSLFGRTREDLA